jgi:Flp pilus assembly protein TadD
MDELKDKPYDLDPATFKTYTLVLLGMIEIKKKDYAAAIGSFDQVIEDNPESAQAYYLRAAAHRLAGDQADADADYRKALELDPQINDKMKAWFEG